MFRPSRPRPLPDPVPKFHLDEFFPSPCPCSVFASVHPAHPDEDASRTTPFEITSFPQSTYVDRESAAKSIREMQRFDESENVLVCIAHDSTLLKVLPFLNYEPQRDLNDWKEKGLMEKAQWGWLNELPRDGKPGRPMLVEEIWREGELVKDFTELKSMAY